MSYASESSSFGVVSLEVNSEAVSNFKAYDLAIKQYPYIIGEYNTFFSKLLFKNQQDGIPILYNILGVNRYSNKFMNSDKAYTQIGYISDFTVNQDLDYDSEFNVDFKVSQDPRTTVETSVGITIPLLPFNNLINVQIDSMASVTLESGVVSDDYPIVARVYLRQRNYPYSLLSKELIFPRLEIGSSISSSSFQFKLDPNLVQTDLPNYAEIVFDFSEMVQDTYDYTDSISSTQLDQGAWVSA